MSNKELGLEKKRKFKMEMPHSYVIVFALTVFIAIMTYVVPAGTFERVFDPVTEKMLVVEGSYHVVEKTPITFLGMFVSFHQGMVESADIIFFIIFAYAFVYVLVESGALNAAVGRLLKKAGDRSDILIPIFMLGFGLLGATAGMFEEIYGLIPVFIGIALAMGYDSIVGGAIVVLGIGTGFSAAVTNPFTIGIAQGIAGVPMFSGIGFRIIIFIVFQTISILFTMRYAKRIKANPELSYMKGVPVTINAEYSKEELMEMEFTGRMKISMVLFALTIGIMLVGTLKLDWYIDTISGLFLIMTIIISLVNGYSANKMADQFIESTKSIVFGALIIGLARSMVIIMEDCNIIDTVVFHMANLLNNVGKYTAGIGMLIIQNIINFFISSGSGKAATTMPIMAPLADMVGLTRQTAVLAFQFGDGFSNLFWPTVVAIECGLMGVPLNKWYKFMAPLFGIMMVAQVVFLIIAIAIGYGPV